MGTTRITQCFETQRVCNSVCFNFYFHANGYKNGKKVSFDFWFDIFDICDYYDKESVTEKEIKQYAQELAWNSL